MHCKGKRYYFALAACIFMHAKIFAQSVIVNESIQNSSVNPLSELLLNSDTSSKNLFIISDIEISGYRKTKPYIIEREINFKRGDSISLNELVKKFDIARRQLMNTRLFNDVVVSLKGFKGYMVEVLIEVKERWYLFPIPYIKPIDRNLTEWAKQGYGLKRVNYGAKLSYYNFSGRNDKLKAWFITGYTRQIEFSYEQPNADRSLKHGYGINVSYATLKEINHNTENNEQRFTPVSVPVNMADTAVRSLFNGQVLNELFNVSLKYTYRPAIRTRHSLSLSYHTNKIDEAVAQLNPRYFTGGKRSISYPALVYTIDYNNIDYVAYPLIGVIGEAGLTRQGFNSSMNLWKFHIKGTRGWQISKKAFFGIEGYGAIKLPFDQPYFNQRLFGYGEMYLRGLEKYVIDGVAGFMARNSLRRELFNFSVPFIHSKSHNRIPFRIYAKTYGDVGYAHNKNFINNSLVNRMLYTAGAGIDVVTFYDFAFRFEYSFNQLGQNGLFVHFRNNF